MNDRDFIWGPLDIEWEIFHTNILEKIKTHNIFLIIFFLENRAVYEIMRKNIVDPETDDNMAQAHFTLIT